MEKPDTHLPEKKKSTQREAGRVAFRGGSYSLLISLVVLAILIVVNAFVSALPTNLTKYDISSSKLYSITSNTKVVVNGLEDDVTIYWIVQSGEEDQVIENLLGKYESLSEHISVVKRNPDVYPTFAQQYTDETVYNNSLVVECGDRSRYISYDDIYLQETDIYSYTYTTSFDGEGAITSAIDYVISEELPQLYVLEGHGETELPATFLRGQCGYGHEHPFRPHRGTGGHFHPQQVPQLQLSDHQRIRRFHHQGAPYRRIPPGISWHRHRRGAL